MADIFGGREGYVVTMPDQRVLPGKIKIDGFEPKAAIISGISVDQRVNQQTQPALDQSVYIYVFGDGIGDVTIEGRTFPTVCDSEESEGIQEIFDYYGTQRATINPDLVAVSVGSEPIVGFLVALQLRSEALAEDPTALYQTFRLKLLTLPKRSSGQGGGA